MPQFQGKERRNFNNVRKAIDRSVPRPLQHRLMVLMARSLPPERLAEIDRDIAQKRPGKYTRAYDKAFFKSMKGKPLREIMETLPSDVKLALGHYLEGDMLKVIATKMSLGSSPYANALIQKACDVLKRALRKCAKVDAPTFEMYKRLFIRLKLNSLAEVNFLQEHGY